MLYTYTVLYVNYTATKMEKRTAVKKKRTAVKIVQRKRLHVFRRKFFN